MSTKHLNKWIPDTRTTRLLPKETVRMLSSPSAFSSVGKNKVTETVKKHYTFATELLTYRKKALII